jgi:hypothetical protein
MKKINMIFALASIVCLASTASSQYVFHSFFAGGIHWDRNPGVAFFSNMGRNQLENYYYFYRFADALNAWTWTGAARYPYSLGMTYNRGKAWDGINFVSKRNFNDPNTTAISTWWYDYSRGPSSLEVDIEINNDLSWYVGNYWTKPTDYSMYTFQGTITHELGHLMNLGHSSTNKPEWDQYPGSATMYYAFIGAGTRGTDSENKKKCTLANWDWDAMRIEYGLAKTWVQTASPGCWTNTEYMYSSNNCFNIYFNPMGMGSDWVQSLVYENASLGGWLDQNSTIEWSEYDEAHAGAVIAVVTGQDGINRNLYYSRNAPNWYTNPNNIGWVDMGGYPSSYYNWVSIQKLIYWDYYYEYGVYPMCVVKIMLQHFINASWTSTYKYAVQNLHIGGW